MKHLKFLAAICCLIIFMSCGGKTDVVESGVYQGTVHEVEADKSEIYVQTEDGKLLELYFTETTSLTRGGSPVNFDQLAEGQKVEVEVIKEGKRLDPVSVKIME
jgi:CspA family cold shock protein